MNAPILTGTVRPIAGAIAVLLSLSLAGCGGGTQAQSTPAAGPPVSVAAVIEKTAIETEEYAGRIEAVDKVEIRPRVSGYIASVNFRPGAPVKKGDVLFVIDPRPFEAELKRAEAAMSAARAKADLASTELARAKKLAADKAIAQRELDEKAAAHLELEAQAHGAQAAFEAARLNLSFTRVESPISGRVSKAELTVGNLADSGVLLTSVVGNNPLYASFDASQAAFLHVGHEVRAGQSVPVRIAAADDDGFSHQGSLEFVDNQIDPATGTVRMRARLDNADNRLAPGLFARIQLAAGGKEGQKALLVADRAIGTDQDRKFVFVVGADGKAEYRQVRLGPLVGPLRIIRSGLKAGERIVVNGLQRVHPGSQVTPQLVPMDADVAHQAAAGKPPSSAAQS
jgi:multidrug efflux system membrane fusion protein